MRDGTFAIPYGWAIAFMFHFVSLSGWLRFKVLLCLLGSVGLHSTSRPGVGVGKSIHHGGIGMACLDD